MTVKRDSVHGFDYAGRHYRFCSAKCLAKFEAEPQRYLQAAAEPAAAATVDGTIYTCPMHPEIRQPTPGNCPRCGMTLEPLLPALDDEENPELGDFRRRFWWTLPLTIVVTILAMAGHRLEMLTPQSRSWAELSTRGVVSIFISECHYRCRLESACSAWKYWTDVCA